MSRWLHFPIGFVTLVALAAGAVRAIVRHMPAGMERWTYETMVLVLAVGFVAVVLRVARADRSEQPGGEA